ncbi:hypothetical protein A4X13_0g9501, partial [Tilletia indica]
MARKRRNKSEISGVAILGVLFLGAIASIPKEAWIALAGVGVIGFGVWLIVKANSDSSRTAPPVMHPQHRPPSSRNRPRAVETDPNRGLVFSLDEVEIEDQAHTGSTRELAPAAEEKVRRRADSEFFTVTLEVSKPSSYRLPSAPATLTDEKVRWIPAGEFVEVAGEKIPALGVAVGQAAQPVGQALARNGEDAGIALADLPLRFAGVLVLDDGLHHASGVTHDATVAGRIGQL